MKIVSGREMAEIDRRTIELGIPGRVLMETAGRAVAEHVRRVYPNVHDVAVLCGPGNNGGDGFVVARVLAEHLPVIVYLAAPRERFQGDARANLEVLERLPILTRDDADFDAQLLRMAGRGLLVDALFGTGLARPVEGAFAEVVARANLCGQVAPIVAVDIPSGVCSATGQVLGTAVRATSTVTFGLPKLGHWLHPGREHAGELEVADIGFPSHLQRELPGQLAEAHEIAGRLPRRGPTSHKGTCGRALLVAGSPRWPGAAILATLGALRSGAGVVYSVVPEEVRPMVLAQAPEAIVVARQGAPVERADAICVGPGVEHPEEFADWMQGLTVPVVVDAGALESVRPGGPPKVLTPHPGELAKLLKTKVPELEADRVGSAVEAARRFECIVAAKGAPTVVAAPDGRYWLNPTGGSMLSQGGMGDVLAGCITGLLAQGLSPLDAALAGVYLHGLAGQLCGHARGVGASQLAGQLPAALDTLLALRA